jgi:hypothetical protein
MSRTIPVGSVDVAGAGLVAPVELEVRMWNGS